MVVDYDNRTIRYGVGWDSTDVLNVLLSCCTSTCRHVLLRASHVDHDVTVETKHMNERLDSSEIEKNEISPSNGAAGTLTDATGGIESESNEVLHPFKHLNSDEPHELQIPTSPSSHGTLLAVSGKPSASVQLPNEVAAQHRFG